MQAIAAAVFGLDAFYACVKERIEIPAETKDAWRNKGTARHAQVSEVLRLGFKIGPKSFDFLRTAVKDVIRFRDYAVHPPGRHDQPIEHPALKAGIEWRFVAFSSENARNATSHSLSIIAQMLERPKEKFPALAEYCRGCKERVQPIVARWEERFGLLWQRPASTSEPAVEPEAR